MEDYVWLQDVKWLPKKSNGKKRIVRALGRTNMQAPQPEHAGTAAACRKCKCKVNKNMQRTVGIGLNIPCLRFHILSPSPAARRLNTTNLEETRN